MPTSVEVLTQIAQWLPSVDPKMIPTGRRGKLHPFEKCVQDCANHARQLRAIGESDARALLRATFIAMPEPVCRLIPSKALADYEAILAAELAASELTDAREVVKKWHADNASKADPRYPIAVWRGDMCRLRCGASMNPANQLMLGCFLPLHKCLDNLLHGAAGPRLRIACQDVKNKLGFEHDENGCPRETSGFLLPHKHVFHVSGPDLNEYKGQDSWVRQPTATDKKELAQAYSNCLKMASELKAESMAFCALSCGVFGYDTADAVKIAFHTVKATIDELRAKNQHIPDVVFNVFAPRDHEIYLGTVFKPEYFGASAAPAAAAAANGDASAASSNKDAAEKNQPEGAAAAAAASDAKTDEKKDE